MNTQSIHDTTNIYQCAQNFVDLHDDVQGVMAEIHARLADQ